jgi:NADH-quinone oxidoreductase subunit M
MLWLYQRMFFGNIDNPKNEKLTDLEIREWVYMTPLVIMSLWIGVYPKAFLDYVQRPVNAVVRQIRPTYPIPGLPPAADVQQRAAVRDK